ncbi:MAG: AlpA family phage regulatory protein [Bauldia litoralis]|uniref:helix-turn-helix transcriptional regulator n=1 Tax=Bauldia litoralis TaxID=665467 RepID=UPI003297EA48
MRIIDWKVLKTIVPYSRQHIQRLELDGLFPKRVQLGKCRVGWVYDEVMAWCQERIDNR